MKRIMILGCSGSGKSTLARSLGKKLNLPIIHLDQYYWQPNWVESSKEEWTQTVSRLIQQDQWIMDGNYGSTFDIRSNRADTIIYLDGSTIKCLWRITRRILKYRGRVRPDMTEGCKERFDLEFYHYVLTYNLVRRKELLKKIKSLNNNKRIEILKNTQEIDQFVRGIKEGSK